MGHETLHGYVGEATALKKSVLRSFAHISAILGHHAQLRISQHVAVHLDWELIQDGHYEVSFLVAFAIGRLLQEANDCVDEFELAGDECPSRAQVLDLFAGASCILLRVR